MNKRGGEKLLSIWWFVILGLVGICVVLGVMLFLSTDIDIRTKEAALVYAKFSNCLVKNGFLSNDFLNSGSNIYDLCEIDKKTFETSFYINMTLKDSSGKLEKEVILGNPQLQKQCEIVFEGKNTAKLTAANYAQCYYNDELVYYANEKVSSGKISFLAASNNLGGRIQ